MPQPVPASASRALQFGLVVVAVVVVPVLFNPRGQEAFDVVKASCVTLLGTLAAVANVLAIRFVPRRSPLITLALVAAASYVVATAFGVAPAWSFLAPGIRHEGAFTTLALVAIAIAASALDSQGAATVLTALVCASTGVSIYAIGEWLVQLPAILRGSGEPVVSSFGNPVLLAGFLVPVIPITFVLAAAQCSDSDADSSGRSVTVGRCACGIALLLQLATLAIARGKGAWVATAAGAAVVGIGSLHSRRPRRWIGLGAALAICAIVAASFLVLRGGGLPGQPSTRARVLIWQGVVRLLVSRPAHLWFGYGPESLSLLIGRFHSPELNRLEGVFVVPDRSHNEVLDLLVSVGLVGTAAVIAVHVALWRAFVRLLDAARHDAARWIVLGLLAGSVAHVVEIQFGLATISSRLVWWTYVGLAAGLAGRVNSVKQLAGPIDPAAAALTGAASIAVLIFDFHQPGRGWSTQSAAVVVAAAAVALALTHRASTAAWRMSSRTMAWVGVPGAMCAALFIWDVGRATSGNVAAPGPALDSARWISNEVTLCELLITGVVAAIAWQTMRSDEQRRSSRLAAVLVFAAVAVPVLIVTNRPARADVLARAADEGERDGRWTDAAALQDARVALVPYSDRAWAARGAVELALARSAASAEEQTARFELATTLLKEALRVNRFDWLHPRNLASAERVWAAKDRRNRQMHLEAADRWLHAAIDIAPANPRLWAEWANTDAERGRFRDAFEKLERAIALNGEGEAIVVGNAILVAAGANLLERESRTRVAEQLARDGFPRLGALYAR